jgi:DNA-binding NarL/FixJ family response regulator
MLGRYLIPLAPFLLIAIHGVISLFFFLSLDHEMRLLRRTSKHRHAAQETSTAELKKQLAELATRVLDAEQRAGVLVPPAPPRSGLNLNKRTQVIRMSRRGERSETIAASLNLSQREVELLLKIHGHVAYRPQETLSKAANS